MRERINSVINNDIKKMSIWLLFVKNRPFKRVLF